jgi:hypothetical protein
VGVRRGCAICANTPTINACFSEVDSRIKVYEVAREVSGISRTVS